MASLVQARSTDGWVLEGLCWTPPTPHRARGVILMAHGVGGRFYSRLLAESARLCCEHGDYITVSVNLRGHDYGAHLVNVDGRTRLQGGAWEDLREGPLDLAGWTEWAHRQWPELPQYWLGHSLGGWKVAHFQADIPYPFVQRLILVSPVYYPASDWWNPEAAQRARRMMADGQGEVLMPDVVSRIGPVSAQTLESRSPHHWPHKLPGLTSQAKVPTLVTYGTEQDTGDADTLRQFGPQVTGRIISGANHHYTHHLDHLVRAILAWL